MWERSHKAAAPPVTRIPRSVAERAYVIYRTRGGGDQTLDRLCERGGFSAGELDMFAPGWREEVTEIARLRAELDRTRAHAEKLRAALVDACELGVEASMLGDGGNLRAAQIRGALAKFYALADTEPRAPGDREIGDTACSVHPSEGVAP